MPTAAKPRAANPRAAKPKPPPKRRVAIPKMHAAEIVPDGHALCRDKGHAWEGIPQPIDVAAPRYGEPRFWRCPRCLTVVVEGINRNLGTLESRRYIYPRDYPQSSPNRIPKATIRLEVTRRLQTHGTEWSLFSAMANGHS